jgi:hypothetical protein
MNFFLKKVTKERLELKTSYLIRQLLTKWSSKTYCNVQEDWGCCCCRPWRACSKVVVVVGLGERAQKFLSLKMALESVLKKNYFHTRKKFLFSMTTRVRSRLAYLEDALYPICF